MPILCEPPEAAARLRHTSWYVVYCKPLHERRAAAALSEILGLAVYLPEILQNVRQRQQERLVALFPRYLFIAADLSEVGLSRINAAPGVLGLVAFGETPRPIEPEVISAIRAQVELLNSTALGAPQQPARLPISAPPIAGLLAGLSAVFRTPMSAEARVQLFLEFLSRVCSPGAMPAPLDAGAVLHPTKRARRTRGRGRPTSRG